MKERKSLPDHILRLLEFLIDDDFKKTVPFIEETKTWSVSKRIKPWRRHKNIKVPNTNDLLGSFAAIKILAFSEKILDPNLNKRFQEVVDGLLSIREKTQVDKPKELKQLKANP